MKSEWFLDANGQKKKLLQQSVIYALVYAVLWFPVMWVSMRWFGQSQETLSPLSLGLLVLFSHVALRIFLEPVSRWHYLKSIFTNASNASVQSICRLQCKSRAIRILHWARINRMRQGRPGCCALLYAVSALILGSLMPCLQRTQGYPLTLLFRCWLALTELWILKRAFFCTMAWMKSTSVQQSSTDASKTLAKRHCCCVQLPKEELEGLAFSRYFGLLCGCLHLILWGVAFGGVPLGLSETSCAISLVVGALGLQQALYRYHYLTLYLPLQAYFAALKVAEAHPQQTSSCEAFGSHWMNTNPNSSTEGTTPASPTGI